MSRLEPEFVPTPNGQPERSEPTIVVDPPEVYKRRLQNGKMFSPASFAFDREIGGMNSRYMNNSLLCGKLSQKDVRGHTGCVNSIEMSRDEEWLCSGGDDKRVFVWRTGNMMLSPKPKPVAIMARKHATNIFATEFSLDIVHVYSGGRDEVFMKHDIETKQMVHREEFPHRSDGEIYQIRQNPIDPNMISVTRSCVVSTYDSRSMDKIVISGHERQCGIKFFCAEFNPIDPNYLLTCTHGRGPLIYDIRNPISPVLDTIRFREDPQNRSSDRGTCSVWSPNGNGFATLFSGKPPVYYNVTDLVYPTENEIRVQRIPLKEDFYINSMTMKTICFVNDNVIAAGSDDNNIYMWKVIRYPEEERDDDTIVLEDVMQNQQKKADRVLQGHRSIPNQVRFSKKNNVLISSGVENSIKIWSSRALPFSYDEPFIRRKRRQYQNSFEEERFEKRKRQELEEQLGDEMEGRATWNDVFGGDPLTAESRQTCEQFDLRARRSPNLIQMVLDEFRSISPEAERNENPVRGARAAFYEILRRFTEEGRMRVMNEAVRRELEPQSDDEEDENGAEMESDDGEENDGGDESGDSESGDDEDDDGDMDNDDDDDDDDGENDDEDDEIIALMDHMEDREGELRAFALEEVARQIAEYLAAEDSD